MGNAFIFIETVTRIDPLFRQLKINHVVFERDLCMDLN